MSLQSTRCTKPEIFLPFEEGRSIILAKYAEKELDAGLESMFAEHLGLCECCSRFVKELQETGDFEIPEITLIHASCPASKDLDDYVFKTGTLGQSEFQKIHDHLENCSLCKEEAAWLRSSETPLPAEGGKKNWVLYTATAAALFFMALSTILFLQRTSIRNTENRLREAAVIKEPNEIDYAALSDSSSALPESMGGVYERGIESLRQRRFQEAIRHLEIVAKAHPDHSGAVYLLGYSYYQMNELDRAFELCNRAEKMVPQSLERCLSLVHIALKTGHYDRAIQEINGLYHAAPHHPAIKETYERIRTITQGRTLKL